MHEPRASGKRRALAVLCRRHTTVLLEQLRGPSFAEAWFSSPTEPKAPIRTRMRLARTGVNKLPLIHRSYPDGRAGCAVRWLGDWARASLSGVGAVAKVYVSSTVADLKRER